MPLRFVWGVKDIDDGDFLDPGDRGLIRFDPSFDVSSADAQRWMLRFCQQLRKQKFYKYVKQIKRFFSLLSCLLSFDHEWHRQSQD